MAYSVQVSICRGMGGRGLEHLPGVCGGLLPLYTESDGMWLSAAGFGVDCSVLQDRDSGDGRDFLGGSLCVTGLCLCLS